MTIYYVSELVDPTFRQLFGPPTNSKSEEVSTYAMDGNVGVKLRDAIAAFVPVEANAEVRAGIEKQEMESETENSDEIDRENDLFAQFLSSDSIPSIEELDPQDEMESVYVISGEMELEAKDDSSVRDAIDQSQEKRREEGGFIEVKKEFENYSIRSSTSKHRWRARSFLRNALAPHDVDRVAPIPLKGVFHPIKQYELEGEQIVQGQFFFLADVDDSVIDH